MDVKQHNSMLLCVHACTLAYAYLEVCVTAYEKYLLHTRVHVFLVCTLCSYACMTSAYIHAHIIIYLWICACMKEILRFLCVCMHAQPFCKFKKIQRYDHKCKVRFVYPCSQASIRVLYACVFVQQVHLCTPVFMHLQDVWKCWPQNKCHFSHSTSSGGIYASGKQTATSILKEIYYPDFSIIFNICSTTARLLLRSLYLKFLTWQKCFSIGYFVKLLSNDY